MFLFSPPDLDRPRVFTQTNIRLKRGFLYIHHRHCIVLVTEIVIEYLIKIYKNLVGSEIDEND